MKLVLKALIGGVIVQVGMFLILLLGILLNLDRFVPTASKAMVIFFLLIHAAITRLVPEGEPHGQGVVVAGILLDTLLYSVVIYFVLLLMRLLRRGA
jgi:hypothetical protein